MSDWAGLAWLVVLLAGNAFFVGGEFAVMSARRSQIEPLAETGHKRARTALYAMEHVSLMLACCQLGITVCSLLILNISEPALHHLVSGPLGRLGVPAEVADVSGFLTALVVVTFLHVVLGEMVPKNMSVSAADRAVLLLAPPLVLVSKLVRPVIATLNWTANHVLRLMGIEPKDEVSSTFTLDELQSIVEESTKEGTVADETGLLSGALEFSAKRAADVMVPLSHLVTLPVDASAADVEKAVARTGFSRFALAEADGELNGYLHLKDVLSVPHGRYTEPVPVTRVRSLANLPPDMEIDEALAVMQRTGSHLARIVDAGGATTGVLFLEDVIEELVGEIRDTTQDRRLRRGDRVDSADPPR
ncbi:hemolysin family protein [Kocuria flava]|uniref:hemolysin family protein n=1 Tax=Kocuria flava TaxID=446860 RepID=UPI000DD37042